MTITATMTSSITTNIDNDDNSDNAYNNGNIMKSHNSKFDLI